MNWKFKDWLQSTRIFATRLKIERPKLATFPRFRTTQFLLWAIAFFGLLYGHVISPDPHNLSISLLLSFASWIAIVMIALAQNPLVRLKKLLAQIGASLLLLIFFVIATVSYSLIFIASNVSQTLRYVWFGAGILFGLLTLQVIYITFLKRSDQNDSDYPGMRSAPILFIFLIVNIIWWHWDTIFSWVY
jgi:bacteriorhodopsin